MSANDDDSIITKVAERHHTSPDAVRTALQALRGSGGTMAQFSHKEFGGMAQWSRGMTMVGDMFNSEMKSKLDAVCADLADYLATSGKSDATSSSDDTRAPEVSYRSQRSSDSSWWPGDLGTPGSTGAQNDMRYAVFPSSRRLAISDGGHVVVYDTGDHDISGVSQSQSTDRTLTFMGQNGLVRVSDLDKVSG